MKCVCLSLKAIEDSSISSTQYESNRLPVLQMLIKTPSLFMMFLGQMTAMVFIFPFFFLVPIWKFYTMGNCTLEILYKLSWNISGYSENGDLRWDLWPEFNTFCSVMEWELWCDLVFQWVQPWGMGQTLVIGKSSQSSFSGWVWLTLFLMRSHVCLFCSLK